MLKSTICLLMITLLNSSGIVLSNPTSTNSSLSSENYYDGTLTMSSPSFVRPRGMSGSTYYYQAIKLTVYTSGTYTLTSSGSLDTYGLLYDTFFDRYYPQSTNLVAYDDDSAGAGQFRISYYLQNGKTYILVVTTSSAYTTGSFRVTASGVGTCSLISYLPSTVSLSGYLSSSKPSFSRPNSYSSPYYYDTYDITVSTTGSYSIRSSSSSLLDTYGCLYRNNFYPSSPSINQMTCNDDYQSGDRQFLLTGDLYSSTKYILVVTTSFTRSTGSYSVAVTGPSLVTMLYSTQGPIYISPTIGGIIGAVSFLLLAVIIFTIIACRRRRLTIYRQTPVVAQYNPNLPNVSYPGVHQPPYGAPPPAYNPYVGSYKS